MRTVDFRKLIQFSPEKMTRSNILGTARLSSELCCFEPGQMQKAQRHPDCDRIYFILDGTGRFTVGRSTREFSTGTAVLVTAGEEHGLINIADEKLVVLVVTAPEPDVTKK